MLTFLYAILKRIAYFEVLVLTTLERVVSVPALPGALSVQRIDQKTFAALTVDPDFAAHHYVPDNVPASSECLVIMDEEKLAAFAWFSFEPATVLQNLRVEGAPRDVYMHSAYTDPGYRGRRLYPRIMAEGFRRYCEGDGSKLISLVALDNAGSLKAQLSMGWRDIGRIWVFGRFGRYAIMRDARCRGRGLRLVAAGPMAVYQVL